MNTHNSSNAEIPRLSRSSHNKITSWTRAEFARRAKSPTFSQLRFVPNLKEKVVPRLHKPMNNQTSGNNLRTHRKRSGLSQHEVAVILGSDAGAICKYERSHHLPPLSLALAYEAVFLVPVSQLFAGLHEAIKQSTEKRLSKLEVELGSRSGKGPQAAITARKLQWLMERRSPQIVT
jgi:transcriptional regulator with XRE-family HTH domain